MDNKISMIHGSGGSATGELIKDVFMSKFKSDVLSGMEDAAVIGMCDLISGSKNLNNGICNDIYERSSIAMTTDSFVVDPVIFAGGDIGRLAICGTVNDLLMRGAIPRIITCGWILEENADIDIIKDIVSSMAETAAEAGVDIVAGDTKVIQGDGGIYINTAGVGYIPPDTDIKAAGSLPGDVIIVSGTMGDHHAALLSERMEIENDIKSDAAPLTEMALKIAHMGVHTMRDVTRGGLATVLKELAISSQKTFTIYDEKIPIRNNVRDFCGLLGLDPLYMGNEGKLVAIVKKESADDVIDAIRSSKYGEHAAIIGEVTDEKKGAVYAVTDIGGIRELDILRGEGLPRIC